jgi:high-affinity iron transporter
MRRALVFGSLAAVGLVLAAASASAAPPAPWRAAADVRTALSDAETGLVLGSSGPARERLSRARLGLEVVLAARAVELRRAESAAQAADAAIGRGDERGFAAARATVWTVVLETAAVEAIAATRRGDVDAARAWLLVREFRPPTRFSRAAADATLALDALGSGRMTRSAAAAGVRADLLDTYDGRLRASLAAVHEARLAGFDVRAAESASLSRGYWSILRGAYVASRGAESAHDVDAALAVLASRAGDGLATGAQLRTVDGFLEGFRAAPLSKEELLRRAGQLDRFLRLVPIEYGRGVSNGRVTKDFEIQEAITFRDGAAAAFRDLESVLIGRDAQATRRLGTELTQLGDALAGATRGTRVSPPEDVEATTSSALELTSALFPSAWKDAAKTADFDVISATLDRLEAAAAAGDWGRAEQARLEAYGVFELGPEQRLRGLAPSLFREVEGHFWYGAGGLDGLVRLLKRKASTAEIAATRVALDRALAQSEERIGAGPGSRASIVTNSAIIVFREGLEAVLILAALMASMVGVGRRFRKPLLGGVLLALVASVVTWIVAQTVLGSLAGWGEKLEAVVSLIAIAVLLLILNWFYHRVYWQENLQDLHRKKKRLLAGASLGILSGQALGLVALGFSSVYREGFETVLFLQALTLEAGAVTVLQGVLVGFAGVVGVFFLVIALERRLPHKKMLIATGILITWVLIILVGQTLQTMQKVGWVPVTPIDGLELPYWSGVWFGLYPTWEGLAAQGAAAAFVIGSYFGAETLRKRRRARILEAPASATGSFSNPVSAAQLVEGNREPELVRSS